MSKRRSIRRRARSRSSAWSTKRGSFRNKLRLKSTFRTDARFQRRSRSPTRSRTSRANARRVGTALPHQPRSAAGRARQQVRSRGARRWCRRMPTPRRTSRRGKRIPPAEHVPETVFFFELVPDATAGRRRCSTRPTGDHGLAISFDRRQFPFFTLWKNPLPFEDGYVTGLEPCINLPNTKSFEKSNGRVAVLEPGETRRFDLRLEVLSTTAEVAEDPRRDRRLATRHDAEDLRPPAAGLVARLKRLRPSRGRMRYGVRRFTFLGIDMFRCCIMMALLGFATQTTAAELGQIGDYELADVDGKPRTAAEWKDAKAVVYCFLGTECPVSNGYAPQMQRLADKYAAQGVTFVGVYVEPTVTADDARKHGEEYALKFVRLRRSRANARRGGGRVADADDRRRPRRRHDRLPRADRRSLVARRQTPRRAADARTRRRASRRCSPASRRPSPKRRRSAARCRGGNRSQGTGVRSQSDKQLSPDSCLLTPSAYGPMPRGFGSRKSRGPRVV